MYIRMYIVICGQWHWESKDPSDDTLFRNAGASISASNSRDFEEAGLSLPDFWCGSGITLATGLAHRGPIKGCSSTRRAHSALSNESLFSSIGCTCGLGGGCGGGSPNSGCLSSFSLFLQRGNGCQCNLMWYRIMLGYTYVCICNYVYYEPERYVKL